MNIRILRKEPSKEEKAEAREQILYLIDFTTSHLLKLRRMAELDGVMTNEEFDAELDKASERNYEKWGSKSKAELLISNIVERVTGR